MRPIDADELKEQFSKVSFSGLAAYGFGLAELHSGVSKMLELIDEAPTVELVKRGEWVNIYPDCYRCSVCGEDFVIEFDSDWYYCPNCGAKMKEDIE